MIVPHYRPSFNEIDKHAVQRVLDSGYIVQGDQVRELENTLAQTVGKQYGVAVSSGTTALTLALQALNVKRGAEVIIPSYTALWHAVKAIDAKPVFADIETDYWNLDPEDVQQKLSKKTAAIIFPHMFGQPGRIQEVLTLGIPVIEDIAQAVGANINGKPAGSFGTISIVSFYATKIIGAGEGGMLFTNDKNTETYLRDIRDYDEKEKLIPRINAKMTDIHAAIALTQYSQMSEFTRKRKHILGKYQAVLNDNILLPNHHSGFHSNLYRCIISHPDRNADELIQLGKKFRVTVRKPVFYPIHLYNNESGYPNTEYAWQKHISIPIFPSMTNNEIEKVTGFLNNIYS